MTKNIHDLLDEFRYQSERIGFFDADKDLVSLKNATMIRERIYQKLLVALQGDNK